MGQKDEKDEMDLEFCYLDETIPPCRECEKHFFHQQQTFNWLEASVVLISIATLVTDLVTDALVTCQYFAYGEYAWGILTLSFTLLPSFIVQFFSLRWYQMDEDLSRRKWIAHGLQLGPLYRYIVVFQTGMAAKKFGDPLDFDLLYHQQSDVCMLRLFESFMESAPQVVLQLYIMVATNEENFFTGISATVSLVSLCWAIAVYSRIHRRVREDKKVVSWPGVLLQAVWRIGMISSRVIALVLFATAFKAYVFIVIAVHWLVMAVWVFLQNTAVTLLYTILALLFPSAVHWFVMAVWVFLQNTDFCRSWLEERLFNAVIAEVYIFCFFNLKEGTSRYRVFIFYSVIFVENVFCLVLWNSRAIEKGFYPEIGFSIVFGGFFVGVTSMILYYRYLHPHSSVGCCKTGDKVSKHQPCLKHEDVLNISKRKGLEAEISPRSHTPSPCLLTLNHHHSPLALTMSQFTTPGSRPLSPGSKLLPSIIYQDEVSSHSYIGNERPTLNGRLLHRAKSEGCLFQWEGDASNTAGMSLAKSVNGLTHVVESSEADWTSRWMDQFARERKSLTQEFFNFLSPDDPIGEDNVNRVSSQCASADVASVREPAVSSRELDHKPASVLRVDSVSRKLLKGGANRKMHRSFRRQLRFEDRGESEGLVGVAPESRSNPDRTAKSDSKKTVIANSKDILKLPVDNVKAKMKVFEALGLSNSDLSKSSPLSGKGNKEIESTAALSGKGNKEIDESSAGNPRSLNVDNNILTHPKRSSEARIQSNGYISSEGSHESKANSKQAVNQLLVVRESGTNQGNPHQGLGLGGNGVGNDPTDHEANHHAKHKTLDPKQSGPGKHNVLDPKQSDRRRITEIAYENGILLPHTQGGPDLNDDGMRNLQGAVQEPLLEEIFGNDEVEVETKEAEFKFEQKNVDKHPSMRSMSPPLSEIQTGKQQSPSKYIRQSSTTGKENKRISKPVRKSFGNVKIEDIKESITNTPKKDVKKSRQSFSRIPTDIVASRVSRLTSTPRETLK